MNIELWNVLSGWRLGGDFGEKKKKNEKREKLQSEN